MAKFKSAKQKSRNEKAKEALKNYFHRLKIDEPGSSCLEVEAETGGSDHAYCSKADKGDHVSAMYFDDSPSLFTPVRSVREDDWREGRHVVDLAVFADALSACKKCGVPLQLRQATSLINYGLSAIIKVPCSNTVCHYINNVPTGRRTNRAWDSNTKLSLAIVHAGIGVRQLNSLLSELNIPTVSESSLRARQNQVGSGFENVAEESMEDAAKEEMRLTAEKSSTVGLTVSVDGAWQKRGSGRGYDSLSGHCSMIGKETGKVVGCAVRSKYCKACDTAIRENRTSKPHDCCKNWEGSSKAMEPDMVIDMVSSHSKAGRHIANIVADDDTTTISRLRQSVNANIKKQSDRNHVRKNIISSLYALQLSQQSLSKKVINYILKCINYMIQQNQGNSDGISKGFDALSRHPFNDHSLCDISWCAHLENPSKKYQSLPYGKALTDKALQKSLEELFERYKRQCNKLSDLGSTQANESFNKTVASKAPKSHFFSGSRNLIHRVAASVAHKNIGHGYMAKVNKKIGLSPGWYTNKLATLRDLQARKRKAISTTRTAKRRRLELKSRRYHYNKTQEVREGTSYSSGIAASCVTEQQIDQIPGPNPPPVNTAVIIAKDYEPVFFDLETTGLGRRSHITQIAAVCGKNRWCTYVTPRIPISSNANKITNISCSNGQLYLNGRPVQSLPISQALDQFIFFCINQIKPLVLAGHNIRIFDCPVLLNALKCNNKSLPDDVAGFIDTMTFFKVAFPGLESYSQSYLFKHITGSAYDAHDALQDVLSLQKLCFDSQVDFSEKKIACATFSTRFIINSHEYSFTVEKNLPSLKILVSNKVFSLNIAKKAAGSGLNLQMIKLAYDRDGVDGVRCVFVEHCGKGVRVTKSSKIINSLCEYFSKSTN